MSEPQYKRVLLKISGEALAGDARRGLDFDVIGKVCDVVKQCVEKGIEVAIVVGGGNFWRGMKDGGDRMQRVRADHMGMLATTINALAVADCLEQASAGDAEATDEADADADKADEKDADAEDEKADEEKTDEKASSTDKADADEDAEADAEADEK